MTIENQNQMNLNLSNHGSQCSLLLNLKDTNRKSLININNIGISCYICCIFVFNYTSSKRLLLLSGPHVQSQKEACV